MISTTVSPGLGSSGAPHNFSKRARASVVDALVIGEHHRDQSRVGRALHVVLAAQRMEARAGPADLAGHEHSAIRQRALSVPWTCCDMPMPHRIIEPLMSRTAARLRVIVSAGMPHTGAIASGL